MKLSIAGPTVLGLLGAVSAVPQVRMGPTTVKGATFAASGVEYFGAMPFAKAPTGALRLQPPVLTTSFPGSTFDATGVGAPCLQTDLPPNVTMSEDCLTLNIFRPAGTAAGEKLPVMFWIYGGGFTTGYAGLYNGTSLVQKSVQRGTPIIYVSVNYRLGPLGFPQGEEAKAKGLLNLGLRDMVAGLQWVQANIEMFGGDKEKVTIFGESAGGTAVFALLVSSIAEGLFRSAILESPGFLPTFGPDRNQATWNSFVKAVPRCSSQVTSDNTMECLQSVNTSSITQGLFSVITGPADVSFFPNLDGPHGFLPSALSNLLPVKKMPILIGNNRDEGTLFVPQNTNSSFEIKQQIIAFSQKNFNQRPSLLLNLAIDILLELYPDDPALGSPFGTGLATFGLSKEYKRFCALYTDFVFQASRRKFTTTLAQKGFKLFGYEFTDPNATVSEPIPIAPGSLGVTHSSEVPYVFGSPFTSTPSSRALSSTMQDYWISFATSLDPNDGRGNKRPQWPQYTTQEKTLLKLDGRGIETMPDNYRSIQMDFIASNPEIFHI